LPSILSDVTKATDQYERQTGKGITGVKAKIPGLRNDLPVKKNIFGEDIKSEPGWSVILFGSRVKTAKDTNITKELKNVSSSVDKAINFTDWDKSSSQTLVKFKESVGQMKYNQAKVKYGNELRNSLQDLFSNPEYQKLSAEDKAVVINKRDSEAQKKVFNEYGFKYKRSKSKKFNL
jgi:hypothetical protein